MMIPFSMDKMMALKVQDDNDFVIFIEIKVLFTK